MKMANKNHSCHLQIDPRTKILLLLLSNLLLFMGSSTELIFAYMVVLALVLLCSRCYKAVVTFGILFLGLICLNNYIFPIAPKTVTMIFSIYVNYTFKMLPCLMAGTLLIKTSKLHDIVLAMRKFHFPQQLIITISVTIRYFPAIAEEVKHIRNAMRLRTIPLSSRVECFVVPLMMAASTTVGELSAAAVTRGIENPVKKTSMIQLHFKPMDYLILTGGLLFILAAFVV